MRGLDSIDRNIIRLLRLNARITNAKLSEEVGLSPSACLRRISLLEQAGVIRGYTALVGNSEGENPIAVIINITLERQTEEHLNRFESAVRRHPEIQECYLMTGGSDYLLSLVVRDVDDLERVHSRELTRIPGVTRVSSSVAMRTVVKRGALPV